MAKRKIPNRARRNVKPVATNVRVTPGWSRTPRVLPRPGGLGRHRSRGRRGVGLGGRR